MPASNSPRQPRHSGFRIAAAVFGLALAGCGFTVGDPDNIASIRVSLGGEIPEPRAPVEIEMSVTDAEFFERSALRDSDRAGYVVVAERSVSRTGSGVIIQEVPPQRADEPDRCFVDDVYLVRPDVDREVLAVLAGTCLPETDTRSLMVDGLFD